MSKEQKTTLKDLLLKSNGVYVLTGAGISTESGIPDFRSKGTGLWNNIDPMKYSTREVLMASPEKFYQYGFPRFRALMDRGPNRGHHALVELEEKGIIQGIITQNIDRLHQKAGSQSVYEVHGSTETCHCMSCVKGFPFQELLNHAEDDEVPTCGECGGILRPDIILFGDPMPDTFFQAVDVLEQNCDFLLVIGTSLQVYPVASLAELGVPIAIINLDETPFDHQAELVIREQIGEALEQLTEVIEEQQN